MSVKNNFLTRSILDIRANFALFCFAARLNFSSSIISAYEPNLFIRKYLKYQSSLFNFNYFIKAVGENDGSLTSHINS